MEETRDSVNAFKKSARVLKREAFGEEVGEDEEEEEEEEEEDDEGLAGTITSLLPVLPVYNQEEEEEEEEGEGEEGPGEEGNEFKSVLFGKKLSFLAEFMSADTDIAILSCVPLVHFRTRFDRNGLIPGDVSSYLTGAAIGAAVAGTGAAIAAVAATARSAADDFASGDQQDHGSRWVLLTTLTAFVGNHAQTSTHVRVWIRVEKHTAELFTKHRDSDMKQPQPGAGAEDHPGAQYRRLEKPVHDQKMRLVRNSVQVEAGPATSIQGSYVFLTSARQASGLETVTAPSSGPGNTALSPREIAISMSPVPFSLYSHPPRIAGEGAGRRSEMNVLEVD